MDRVQHMRGGTPQERRAAELLNNVRPLGPSPEAEARVWQRLHTPRTASRGRWLWLALMGTTIAGTATAGWRWLDADSPAPSAPSERMRAARIKAPEPARPLAVPLEPEASPAPPPAAPARRKGVPALPAAKAPSLTAPPGEVTKAESELVQEAVRALRRDHDPARARQRLTRYLKEYPAGLLAEEALALLVEAAAAMGAADAHDLAAQYAKQYPQGQYRTKLELLSRERR